MNNLPDPDRTYRVVQWAAGTVGGSAIRAVIRHPKMELVGVKVFSDSKEGQDAGKLAGLDPVGVKATRNSSEILALKPDCVLYMQEGFDIDDMSRLLEAGINIVTTRSEFFNARQMLPEYRDRLENACRKGGSSLFATGSSPGFSTLVLPVAMLYMSRRLDCLTIDEFADIPSACSLDMITEVMGYGRPPLPEQVSKPMLDHMSEGFAQSLGVIADSCGITLDDFQSKGEAALANSPIPLWDDAVIEKGTVAGLRITISGMKNGEPVLQFRANWYCSKDIDQDWELNDNGWRLTLEGDAPMKVDISYPKSPTESHSDQMAGLTAHPAVNAIPYVCQAAPGIRHNLDMRQVVPWLG